MSGILLCSTVDLPELLFIVSVMRWHCCIVECACWKPNWWCGNQSCGFISLLILLSMSLANTFEIMGNRLIGRYDEASVRFFPSLFKTKLNSMALARERYLFYSSSSSIDLTRLSGPRSRPTTTQKIW
jgi:hypothetical protein